ncbi:hypothetical protein [Colwellia psychrerythraea]|uniref:Guanylate cyclase domain-containing protein n=1 Tax=Colwellia psychrerythraea TaxID=28229 RepID=A0A099KKD5_COLPS|nr:hypothetical protein [Colwellia psychrerythraea]KGJ90710.1 hypothetical protein GAB14E_3516 [Colwellia psychrerythraea]
MEVKILNNRLIAFLDVLGFTAFLKKESLENVHMKYSEFIDEAKTRTFFQAEGDNTGRSNFEYAEFISDSIILVSNPIDDVFNVNSFVAAVSFLFEMGFISNLPLRGAIGKGDFLIDIKRKIFISKEFANVVHFEGQQEWSGCVILDSAEDIVIESIFGEIDKERLKTDQMGNNLVINYDVPLKEKKSINLFVVNFLIFLTKEQIFSGIDYLINPKKENNKRFFEFLNTLPFEFQMLPQEFHPAVKTLMTKTRSGMRISFLDSNGNPCQPGVKEIQWMAVGRWK